MGSRLRIGLLVTADSPASSVIMAELMNSGLELAVAFFSIPGWRANVRRALRKLRASGLRETLLRIVYAAQRRFKNSRRDEYERQNVPLRVHYVSSFNSQLARDLIRSEQVDVLLAITDEILKRGTFCIPRFGVLNAHPGWIPTYRGLSSVPRMLRDGYLPAVSVHFIDEGIDTGPVLLRRSLGPEDVMDGSEGERRIQKAQARAFIDAINLLASINASMIDTFAEASSLSRSLSASETRWIMKSSVTNKASLRSIALEFGRLQPGSNSP